MSLISKPKNIHSLRQAHDRYIPGLVLRDGQNMHAVMDTFIFTKNKLVGVSTNIPIIGKLELKEFTTAHIQVVLDRIK